MSRSAKESSFGSHLHRFTHHLIVSIIHHREEHDKFPLGDLFPMWCLLYTDVHLHIPYTIASFFFSSLALGSLLRSKICGGHFICRLAQLYGVDTHGMTYYPLRELDGAALTWL